MPEVKLLVWALLQVAELEVEMLERYCWSLNLIVGIPQTSLLIYVKDQSLITNFEAFFAIVCCFPKKTIFRN